jgi:DNA-binding CsgD family transcriptional regulator
MSGGLNSRAGQVNGRQRKASPIRGRTAELETLDSHIAALVAGRGGVLVIEGPPGIGKSRLLEEFTTRAQQAGARTLSGEAFEYQQSTPFFPLFTATLQTDLPVADAEALRRSGTSVDVRYWVVHDLRAAIDAAAQENPLAIVLENVHWADNATLLALRSLAASRAGAPVLWVLTARSGAGGPEVRETLSALARDGADYLRLTAMSDSAVAAVVQDVLRARADESLLTLAAKAHGNPFLVMELLGGLDEEGRLEVSAGKAVADGYALPRRLSAGMQQRLERLTEAASEVVRVAAVLPDRFSAELLAKVLERSPAALISAVDEAVEADLLVEDGDRLRFAHDLLREATRQMLPSSLRRAMECQSATTMLDMGAAPAEVAVQLARSAERGDQVAIAALRKAAQFVATSDAGSAAELSRRALELLPDQDPQRGPLVAETVELLNRAARYEEAKELGAAALAAAVSPEEEAAIRLRLAAVTKETPRQRVEEHRRALDLSRVSDITRARHLAWLAYTLSTSGQSQGAETLEEAVAAAAATADLECKILTETTFAFIEGEEGYPGRATGRLRDLQRVTEGTDVTPAHVLAAIQRVSLSAATGRLDEAASEVAVHAANARGERNAMMQQIWAVFEGLVHMSAGRLSAARAAIEAVPVDGTDSTQLNMVRRFVLMIVAVSTGDRNLLRDMVLEARDAFETGSPGVRQTAAAILAFAAWDRGDAYEAARWFGNDTIQRSTPYALEILVLSAHVATASGDAGLRAAVLQRVELLRREQPPIPLLAAVAQHALGIVERDADALVAAANTQQSCSRPLLYAQAAHDAGTELARCGRESEALEMLNAAFDVFVQCEAITSARNVARELRQLGTGRRILTHRRDKTGWASLTDAELKVVMLILEDATNRTVADRLHLSLNTVKTHVRNAFTKLGVNSRAQLRQALSANGADLGEWADRR